MAKYSERTAKDGDSLSRSELTVLRQIDSSGDYIDVQQIADDMQISRYTLRDKIRSIRVKVGAPTTVYLEGLPAAARDRGMYFDSYPDDGRIKLTDR